MKSSYAHCCLQCLLMWVQSYIKLTVMIWPASCLFGHYYAMTRMENAEVKEIDNQDLRSGLS